MSYKGSIIVQKFEAAQRKPELTKDGWQEVDPPYAFRGEAILAPGIVIPGDWRNHTSALRIHEVSTPRAGKNGLLWITFRGEIDAPAARELEKHVQERDWLEREIAADIIWRLQLMGGPHHQAAPLPQRTAVLTSSEQTLLETVFDFDEKKPVKIEEDNGWAKAVARLVARSTAPTPDYPQVSIPVSLPEPQGLNSSKSPTSTPVNPGSIMNYMVDPEKVPEHLKVCLEPLKKPEVQAPIDQIAELVKSGLVSMETLVELIGRETQPGGTSPPPPVSGSGRRRTVDI
jgi:hypothetical protein